LEFAGVTTLARLAVVIGAQNGRYEHTQLPMEERVFESETDLVALEQYATRRIADAAIDGRLWLAPHLGMLLFDWKRLEGEGVRVKLGNWITTAENLVRFLRALTVPSSNGQEILDQGSIAKLVDVDDVASAARRALSSENLELRDRAVLQRCLDGYAETEDQRNEDKARRRVLEALLQSIADTGWYPTMHLLRTQLTKERGTIDRLSGEKWIGQVIDTLYMVLLPGLEWCSAHPVAKRELQICRLLLERLQLAHTSSSNARLSLAQLQTEFAANDASIQLNDLRRAALVLMRMGESSGGGAVGIQFGTDGLPNEVVPMAHVLDFSPEEFSQP
jgi:hypothetical protein